MFPPTSIATWTYHKATLWDRGEGSESCKNRTLGAQRPSLLFDPHPIGHYPCSSQYTSSLVSCLPEHLAFACHSLTSGNVQEPRAARAPEELPTSGAEHVAPDLLHIHLQLPYRLAGIQHVENAEPPANVTHLMR